MKNRPSLVVIGGSAGSLQVILKTLQFLDDQFDIPILLVLHRLVNTDSPLEDLLRFRTRMHAGEVEEKEPIRPSHIYVTPADYHVLIEKDHTFSLDYSEKVNFSRPSIDVVFRSAADAFGADLLCILLSGANGDGALGLQHVQRLQGTTVVQSPADAQVPYMPEQALKLITPDHVLDGDQLSGLLNSLIF